MRPSDLVLSLLSESGGELLSGEAIAAKLGLDAGEVFHAIEELRAQGTPVEASPAGGYRLGPTEPSDAATQAEIGPLLATRELGWAIHHHEVIASTNDVALKLARAGAAHGEVVIADRQTAGRGRRGRSWSSPARVNLYLSVILRPQLPPQRAPELVSVVAVAAAETLREMDIPAGIKWPNDLVIDGRKVAGILTELSADGARINFVVVGIGINVNATQADFPEELHPIATSLRIEKGAKVSRAELAAALLGKLERWLDLHQAQGFAPIRERYRVLSATLGQRVRLIEPDREVLGTAEDIDEAGALFLRKDDGTLERVLTGDVTSLRLAAP